MNPPDPRLPVLAALLAQGRIVHLLTGVLTLGVWGFAAGSLLWIGLGLLLFVGESWLAVRVGLDAALFDALARGLKPEQLDRGLLDLGLVRERRPRALASRIRGAVRLWRWQLVFAIAQGTLFVAVWLRWSFP